MSIANLSRVQHEEKRKEFPVLLQMTFQVEIRCPDAFFQFRRQTNEFLPELIQFVSTDIQIDFGPECRAKTRVESDEFLVENVKLIEKK